MGKSIKRFFMNIAKTNHSDYSFNTINNYKIVKFAILMASICSISTTHSAIFTEENRNYIESDGMRTLIKKKQDEKRQPDLQPIFPKTATIPSPKDGGLQTSIMTDNSKFNHWLATSRARQNMVAEYQRFIQHNVGFVPPMDQLLASARSAKKCGYEPFEIPPQYLWENIVPTLRLIQTLKSQGYLPQYIVIRSVYRNPSLNRCAGGAPSSKHLTNGAVDIWIPEYEGKSWKLKETARNLCLFWQSQGEMYNFGLGLYTTGSIHIDTQGYRKWGGSHNSTSQCF